MNPTIETPKNTDPEQEEIESFWDKAIEKDYLNKEQFKKFGINAVKLVKFKEIKTSEEGSVGLVFDAQVMNGPLGGKVKELTIWDKKAVKLSEQLGRDYRRWVGTILTITFSGSGQYEQVVYTRYVKLDDGAQAPHSYPSKTGPEAWF